MVTEITRPLRIVVVEDYDVLREAIVDLLRQDGHQVTGLAMAEDIDDEVSNSAPDLYVIDLNLPGEDGISLAQRIHRSQPEAMIVIASARTGLDDRLAGYEAGASVYLSKPIALEELRAIISNFCRRQVKQQPSASCGILDPQNMQLTGPTTFCQLSQAEASLLTAFSRSPQNVLENWQVAQQLFGDRDVSKDYIEVKLSRLRKKITDCGIGAPAIQVIRGHGYKLCFNIVVLVT